MPRPTHRDPHHLTCPPKRPRPSRGIVLLLALLVASFVSVGSAIADTEAPPVPDPVEATAMPEATTPAAPEAPVVEPAPEVPEPSEPVSAEDGSASTEPVDAAPVDPVDAGAAPEADAGPAPAAAAAAAAVAPVAAESAAAPALPEAASASRAPGSAPTRGARPDAAPAPIQARNHVCPDPNVPGSYRQGGACKVNVCHATGSETNPYVFISPNVSSTHTHGHEGHDGDIIGVANRDACPEGTTDPCDGVTQPGAYSDGNNCVVDICHATGSPINPYNRLTVSANGLNGHGGHQGDIIPAPDTGCPGSQLEGCEPPAYENTNGQCVVDICHATGSTSNPYTFITVSVNGLNGHGDHEGDIIPAPANGCPPGDGDDCPAPGYENANGQCVVDICHATGSSTNPYVLITVSINGLNGHGGHPGDIIPAPANGCPPGDGDDCPAPGYENANGQCVVDICHATGSSTNPFVLITVSINGLNGHGDHPGDIIPAPAGGCPTETDACPGPLNPDNQPPGTVCITDACPDELNPGPQQPGTPCIGDACPGILNPGPQAPGTDCIVDACPDALNPGNQAPGTICAVPTPPLTPTPTPVVAPAAPAQPAAPAAPAQPEQPAIPAQPEIAEVAPEPEPVVVLGQQVEPVLGASAGQGLPFTGARTFGLTMLGLLAFLAGATLVRRRPRATD